MGDPLGFMLPPLFEAAVHDYQKQTGVKLIDHPLARKLENCNSVESITSVLQEQARSFIDFRRDESDDGKVMKLLKHVVHVLHTLSISTTLREGISLVSVVCRVALVVNYFFRRCFFSHSPLQRQYLQHLLSCSVYGFLRFYVCVF